MLTVIQVDYALADIFTFLRLLAPGNDMANMTQANFARGSGTSHVIPRGQR